ncbi:BTB/POZ domain-containing protein [Aspergillus affinis]|uniref:BTB/POZ domain-containing protein n=1 Tax=Aspergillus affinis TaxID=1070780 RepID=UPI0022FE56FA|nr:uncharacterized protein KD926_005570 [Aspergillus affinis]KAI9042489.1 hypothetical protein KD926_005570 [Aspergillus affinis]
MAPSPFYEHIYSEIVQLRSSDSGRHFNVHKDLLESKCKVMYSALSKGFLETKEGVYTCTDTTHGTLALAVEWMYTGTYTEPVHHVAEAVVGQPPGMEQEVNPNSLNDLADETKSHPIIAHLQLYIFSDLYLMAGLKQTAFQKLTGQLTLMDKAKNVETQRAVIAMLHLAFSKINPDDELLGWLAHFASWNLLGLLPRPLFHDLLVKVPALGSLMMYSLYPAKFTPWSSRKVNRG